MSQTLLVPIHVDALCLDAMDKAVGPMADYKQLPSKVTTDYRSNKNLGQTALTQQEFVADFNLGAGIHLHWALPDALTNGVHEDGKVAFPVVPNRWVVCRTGGGKADKQWMVESDYLYPDGVDAVDFYNPYEDEEMCGSGDSEGKPIPAQILVEPPVE